MSCNCKFIHVRGPHQERPGSPRYWFFWTDGSGNNWKAHNEDREFRHGDVKYILGELKKGLVPRFYLSKPQEAYT